MARNANTDNKGKLLVTVFAFAPAPGQLRNFRCTRTPAFAEATAVKACIWPQLKSCTLTDFWLRDKLYRNTAPVLVTKFVTGDKFVAPIKLVPRSRQNVIEIVPWPSFAQGLRQGFGPQRASEGEDGKKHAIPLLPTEGSAKVGLAP